MADLLTARGLKFQITKKHMSQALEVYSKINDPFAAAIQIGSHFAKSGMFGVDRAEAGTILALACITENRTPFEIARTYDIVEGKLRKKALACFAEFRKAGGRVKWINTGDDGKEAEADIEFEGQTLRVKFTIEDARKQGLIRPKSAWEKTPGNMLRARVISNAIGMLAPEIVAGLVDGDDEQQPEPNPVLQATVTEVKPTAPTPKPAPKQEPKIVDAEIVQPKTETASPEPTPTPTPPATSPTREIFVAKANEKGELTNETILALQEAIGEENAADFIKWLLLKQWIPKISKDGIETGELKKMSLQRAQRILDKPEVVLNFIRGELKAQA